MALGSNQKGKVCFPDVFSEKIYCLLLSTIILVHISKNHHMIHHWFRRQLPMQMHVWGTFKYYICPWIGVDIVQIIKTWSVYQERVGGISKICIRNLCTFPNEMLITLRNNIHPLHPLKLRLAMMAYTKFDLLAIFLNNRRWQDHFWKGKSSRFEIEKFARLIAQTHGRITFLLESIKA